MSFLVADHEHAVGGELGRADLVAGTRLEGRDHVFRPVHGAREQVARAVLSDRDGVVVDATAGGGGQARAGTARVQVGLVAGAILVDRDRVVAAPDLVGGTVEVPELVDRDGVVAAVRHPLDGPVAVAVLDHERRVAAADLLDARDVVIALDQDARRAEHRADVVVGAVLVHVSGVAVAVDVDVGLVVRARLAHVDVVLVVGAAVEVDEDPLAVAELEHVDGVLVAAELDAAEAVAAGAGGGRRRPPG